MTPASHITLRGIGLLSALGADTSETLAALREGESALFPDANGNPCGAAPEPDTQRWLGGPSGFLDRTSLLMMVATAQALEAAALDPKTFPFGRFGVMAGTVWAGVHSASLFFRDAVEKGPRLVKPMLFPHTYGNSGVSLVAMRFGLSGPHGCDMTGRIASGQAFVEAVAALRACHADAMLVVGAESLSPQRRAASRHVLGEAGAACVLQGSTDFPVRASGVAHGLESPCSLILSARCGTAVIPTVRAALADANLTPSDLSLVVSSASGNPDVDRLEAVGLREVLDGAQIPVAAPLAFCGELEGANAVFLVSVASLCLCHKIVPPVLNVQTHVDSLHYARGNETLAGNTALVLATDMTGACFACVLATTS